MITISLCIVVRNEAEALEETLKSCASAVDEIIVVDAGSADSSMQIARRYADKAVEHEWTGDWSLLRNYSFSKASGDYILWLDAGEILRPADQRRLTVLKRILPRDTDAVRARVLMQTDSAGRAALWYDEARIVRRDAGCIWEGRVHELLRVKGTVRDTDLCIVRPQPSGAASSGNLEIYNDRIAHGEQLNARDTLFYARELRNCGLLQEAAGRYQALIDMTDALPEERYAASFEGSFCYEQLKEEEEFLNILLKSFRYSLPRPEICCRIGDYHFGRKAYPEAAYWYRLALSGDFPRDGGYIYENYLGYIPTLQLCLCCYNMGDLKKAEEYNDEAGKIRPRDSSVMSNRRFFETLKKKKTGSCKTEKREG